MLLLFTPTVAIHYYTYFVVTGNKVEGWVDLEDSAVRICIPYRGRLSQTYSR